MSVSGDIIIFIGPPGSGKGSLSHLCVKNLGWTQLSTGNLCRNHIVQNTPIGQKIDFAMKSGKLIDDGLVVAMVRDWLSNNQIENECVILDGFPRTVAQSKALSDLLELDFVGAKIHVIKLAVSSETVVKRLVTRTICPNAACQAVYSKLTSCKLECDECGALLVVRSDDTVDTIKERLALFNANEKELLDFYISNGRFLGEINVEQPLENVFQDFMVLLSSKVLNDCA